MNKALNNLHYRISNEPDIKQLQELCSLAYGQYASVISADNLKKWRTGFEDEQTFLGLLKIGKCLVCEDNLKIVGMAFLIPSGNPLNFFQADWSYIRFVAVDPEYEGNGIAKKLTHMCIEEARNSREKCIALHTSEFQNAARHIYEKLGFIRQNEFELYNKRYWIYKLNLDSLAP
jgi:ribosomal protein S18 acetylase RimI-like enzyme